MVDILRKCQAALQRAVPLYIPTSSVRVLRSLCILTSTYLSLGSQPSSWFWFVFSYWINNAEYLFVVLLAIWLCSLGKCLFKSFAHFSIRQVFFVQLVLYLLIVYQIFDFQILSPSLWAAFSFFCSVIWYTNFLLWYSSIYLLFCMCFFS